MYAVGAKAKFTAMALREAEEMRVAWAKAGNPHYFEVKVSRRWRRIRGHRLRNPLKEGLKILRPIWAKLRAEIRNARISCKAALNDCPHERKAEGAHLAAFVSCKPLFDVSCDLSRLITSPQ